MLECKYYYPDYRVKLSIDKYTKTTIVAMFQKRYFGVFWKTVKEVNFDVFDYAALGKEDDVSYERMEEIKRSSYQFVTISYDTENVRELWHPKDFNLEEALERHSRKLITQQPDEIAI